MVATLSRPHGLRCSHSHYTVGRLQHVTHSRLPSAQTQEDHQCAKQHAAVMARGWHDEHGRLVGAQGKSGSMGLGLLDAIHDWLEERPSVKVEGMLIGGEVRHT